MAQPETGTVAVVGAAGAIGRSVSAELRRRSIALRVVGRNLARLQKAFPEREIEKLAADAADQSAVTRALSQVNIVIYAVGVPYPEFKHHPLLMRSIVEAARNSGVTRLAVVSSVYSYGVPQTPRVAENHPRAPQTKKGRMRKEQEDIALEAHDVANLQTLVLRLPDFYGPHAELSLADQVFKGALSGKPANWIGSPDLPHEFLFVPDVGPVLADLISQPGSFGNSWNLGGPGTITGRGFIAAAYKAAGKDPRFREVGPFMLRVGGVFNPLLRELIELHYLATSPVILDDSKLSRHLGRIEKTPYQQGILKTLEWYRGGVSLSRDVG
jgi:nucleoside-diphosphate-sugar epimerase